MTTPVLEPTSCDCDCCRRWQAWASARRTPAVPADQRPARPAREVAGDILVALGISTRHTRARELVTEAIEADRAARPPRDVQGEEPWIIAAYPIPSPAEGNGFCNFCGAEVPFAELQSVNQRGIAGLVACAKCSEPAASPLPDKEPK